MLFCRNRHFFALTLVLTLPSWNAKAADLKLFFEHSETATSTVQANLRTIPIVTSVGEQLEILEQTVHVPGELTLDLGVNTTWRFELNAEGFWNESVTVNPGQQAEARLMLHPTAEVSGTLELTDENGEIPPHARLRFTASATRDREDTGIRGELECLVEAGGRFQCQVPVGTFDLRVRLDGFISHYFWEQPLEREEFLDLGTLKLEPGSSLVGWVNTEDRELIGEGCTATLLPQGTEEAEPQRRIETTQVDGRGFFHFEGLAPGNYRLVAKKSGYAPAPVDNILIFPGLEANLRETLVLRRPLEPTFLIAPATDLANKPWRLELLTTGTVASRVALGFTDPEGRYRPGKIAAGEYRLRVTASDGTKAASEQIVLDPRTTEFTFEIPTVWVEGRITFGGEPLAARLYFGGTHGTVSVPMVSDEEGHFTGALPRDGEWALDIKAGEPNIFRRLRHVEVRTEGSTAWVEIDLPDTVIEAEVVDEEGEPVAEATVLVVLVAKAENGEAPAPGKSDEEGIYQVHGAAYGEYRLEAHLRTPERFVSEPVIAHLSELTPTATVRLTLVSQRKLQGRILSATGAGIQGASVTAMGSQESRTLLVPRTQTGPRGEFELFLPKEMERATLYVMNPGFVFAVQEVEIDAQQRVVIVLQERGGDLLLKFSDHQEEGLAPPQFTVQQNGVPWESHFLFQWLLANGAYSSASSDLRIPTLPPGHYRVCFLERESQEEVCEAGNLAVGGFLELFARTEVDSDG